MDQTKQLYRAVSHLDAVAIKELLNNGCSPNAMRKDEKEFRNRNVGLELLKQGVREESWVILDILLESGLNVNHQDDDGDTILLYLLDVVRWYKGLHRRNTNIELKNLYKNNVIRIKKTFEKLMERRPILSNSTTDVFEYVFKLGVLSWFLPYVENMNKEDRKLYEEYRLATLLEEPFMWNAKKEEES